MIVSLVTYFDSIFDKSTSNHGLLTYIEPKNSKDPKNNKVPIFCSLNCFWGILSFIGWKVIYKTGEIRLFLEELFVTKEPHVSHF